MVGQQKKSLTILVFVVLAVIAMASVSVAAAQQSVVKEIVVENNKRIGSDEILKHITHTKVGEIVSEEAVEADRQAIFETGYFWSVQPARVVSVPGGVKVVFPVVENPVVSSLTIENDVLPVDELAVYLKTRVGEVLNINELREDLNTVLPERSFKDYGIPVRVADASVSPDTGAVKIILEEKRLSQIKVVGNDKTQDYVILRELRLSAGDVVNIDQINKGLHRVLMLGHFDEVGRDLEPTNNPDEVVLTVKVKERKTGVFTGGVGYSSNEGFIGYLEVADENFLGRGERVNFRWEFGKNKNSYDIGFYEPYVDRHGTSLGFNVYHKSRTLTNVEDNTPYEKISVGGDVTLGRPLTEFTRGYLTTKMEQVRIGTETENTRSVKLTTVTNTSNHPFFPTAGHKVRLSTEVAGYLLGGDNDFIKYEGDYSKYLQVGSNGQTLAFRVSGGLLTGDDVPDYEKFRVGGAETVRGYDYGDFKGTKELVINSEYRFKIKDAFHGVLFADMGNAWESDEAAGLDDLHIGYGAGLRIDTPLGVMRFDYGRGEGEGNFYFSIGQMF